MCVCDSKSDVLGWTFKKRKLNNHDGVCMYISNLTF
jgi:hypothetical protein